MLEQIQILLNLLKVNVSTSLAILGIFWLCFLLNVLLGFRLNIFGIYPRHIWGLIGIPFAPFLHGSFNHLFFNSLPLFVLVDFLLINGMHNFLVISISIILLSGFATWLFGRRGIHIGASALIMGYFSYLLVNAYKHPSIATIILAIFCLYYFGGLLLDLFPREEKVSWEGHVFGFVAGLVTAYLVI